MSDDASPEQTPSSPEEQQTQGRRLFLRSLGKWSGAAIAAIVTGTWLASGPQAAGSWINRRGGGGWINRGGGWINRRGGGGGSWINRW